MNSRPDWAQPGIDVDRPNLARIYDYLLGGAHNFAVDRAAAEQMIAVSPDARQFARGNRAFLGRVVRYCVSQGVRQFLDLGSGIPTAGNVHEVAQGLAPESRVVYVDIESVAIAHGRALLADNDRAAMLQADFRDPRAVLEDPTVTELLDLSRPLALLALFAIHAVSDADDPRRIVATYRDALAPGSYLALSHVTHEVRPEETARMVELTRRTPTPVTPRSRVEIERFLDGFAIVDPGLVWVSQWRPDSPADVEDPPEWTSNLVGVGRR